MATYHKLETGEWVAYGSRREIVIGPIEITKRGGGVCHRVIDEVVNLNGNKAYGYLTEHCKPTSREAHDKRKGMKEL